MPLRLSDCLELDSQLNSESALADAIKRFHPGQEATLYFDANSIGPMPRHAPEKLQEVLEAGWALARRRSWNKFDWLEQPQHLGASIAHLIGAAQNNVIVCDTTSINQYKLLRLALKTQSPKRVVVIEKNVFPSNSYIAQCLENDNLAELRFISDSSELPKALEPNDVAVVTLSHVDYRSSMRLDMLNLSSLIREAGALSLWDLSHSAGAVAVDLQNSNADLAVGCGYKYLCGGPGAPAYMYVHPRLLNDAWPAIGGWMGHSDTFSFDPDYLPNSGIKRFLVGTPSVLSNVAFSAAADIWRGINPQAMEQRHKSLTNTLIQLIEERCGGWNLKLASPKSHSDRGGHVAFQFEHAEKLAQALVHHGVVVSSRKPDALRWGVHPLATTHEQIWRAVEILRTILESQIWQDARFNAPSI